MAEIELSDVSKRYPDGTEAVKGLDLRIANGEFVILVGPSGCGKTTALRMIAGLEEVSDGEVRIGGRVVNDLPPKDRDIAMVFQNYALYPHMSVRQNMAFALKLRGIDRATIADRVEDAATALDLTAHLDRKPARLSGGQRQRVAMGRAIVRDPSAFLMDEPLSNLDAKLRVHMRAQLARLQSRLATTTVYVTHDQTEAMTLGDRVAVMREGVLQQVGAPRELYERPANVFVAGFVGSPSMNLLDGELGGDAVHTAIGDMELNGRLRGGLEGNGSSARRVVVGIRPEHVEDAGPVNGARPADAFEVPIELTETVGPDVYAHFPVNGERGALAVARLHAGSEVRSGERRLLRIDPARVHVFGARDGRCLTLD